jgi:sulfite reductase (ferredoxin)
LVLFFKKELLSCLAGPLSFKAGWYDVLGFSMKLSAVETMKTESRGLRGHLAEELAEGGLQVSEEGYNLLKFHGSYEQFDRDTATERKQHGIEKEYQFMLRVRMPGGVMSAAQYLGMDRLADDRANHTIRITTRQGIQFHGILKGELKPAIADINHTMLTTMSACGDVVRNIMASPTPRRDARALRIAADARRLSEHLKPKSRAYYQIFLDEAPNDEVDETETLYGETYLPRKFKIGITHAADNTIDVLTNDLGIVAHFAGDVLEGYTVAVGGGLGMTHNKPRTYPRLATPIAFVGPDELVAMVEAVIRLQRDHGDRTDRRRARLKYVVDDRGLDWVRETLATYFGAPLLPPRALRLEVPDLLGWHEQGDGNWWLGVPVAAGRIADFPDGAELRTALRTIAQSVAPGFVLTPQQDVLLTDIAPADRAAVEAVLRRHKVVLAEAMSPMAQYALSCPALPTCGLALTEAERMHGEIVGGFDALLAKHGLSARRVSVRITGCPNGCARTYAGDIGIVGRMPGFYALYVGGDFEGTRLSFKLLEKVPHAAVISSFDPLFAAWAKDGAAGEGFGDFCFRLGMDGLLALGRGELSAA